MHFRNSPRQKWAADQAGAGGYTHAHGLVRFGESLALFG
jgi:hypothetical protein